MANNLSPMDAYRQSLREIPIQGQMGDVMPKELYEPKTQRERDNLEAARRIMDKLDDPSFSKSINETRNAGGTRRGNRTGKSLADDIDSFMGGGQQAQRNTPTNMQIRESFEQMPQMNTNDIYKHLYEQQQYAPKQQSQPLQITSGIDYNALKFIINEAIKENLEKIKQELNENVVSGVSIGNGKKIYFSDTKGNIYEGQLVLKKRAQ